METDDLLLITVKYDPQRPKYPDFSLFFKAFSRYLIGQLVETDRKRKNSLHMFLNPSYYYILTVILFVFYSHVTVILKNVKPSYLILPCLHKSDRTASHNATCRSYSF